VKRLFRGLLFAGRLFAGALFRRTYPPAPEGTFRRESATVRFTRRATAVRFTREANVGRVFTWKGPRSMANRMPADSLTKTERESRYFLFDFSKTPEVRAGWTLSSPAVHVDTGLTAGTPAVSDELFDGVPAGEGVIVLLSGGDEDEDYDVSCTAVATSGARSATIEVPGRVVVAGVGT
jgi:hypothetical protein